MKQLLLTLLVLSIGTRLFAQELNVEDIRGIIAKLIRHANIDYSDRRGEVVLDNEQQVIYKVTVPYHDFGTDNQYITVTKASKQALFTAVYFGNYPVNITTKAFTGFDDPNEKDDNFDKTGYKGKHKMQTNTDGYLTDTIFYKTLPVAVLNTSATDNSAVITIGIVNSKNLAAEKAMLPPMIEQPYPAGSPFDHMRVNGNIITVHDWGKDFDGDYDVSVLAKDSCVSGNCVLGKGRKVLASIVNGQPRIRIMQGKFRRSVFLGSGVMLIDGEGPAVDGTYEIQSFTYSYTNNYIGAKGTFHTKVGNEVFNGEFNGYYDWGIGAAFPEYQKFVKCEFRPNIVTGVVSPYMRDAYWPQSELEVDIDHASAQYRKDEAKRLANNAYAANQKAYSEENDKCTCCGGKGIITQHDLVHFQVSGNNYMEYYSVKCTCCNGTGLKKYQTVDKIKNNGTYIIK
ncbi:hypothetical protein [uncultured Mucilaginibacter sp.]|uniref:hypothetical protein n=1 Tax=uncultured Mucilaginibacter sp. TaxID=797541 RepID=UPI0025FE3B87|nr:hypothetical protein [uncultured Mucilaginibacter sp.]